MPTQKHGAPRRTASTPDGVTWGPSAEGVTWGPSRMLRQWRVALAAAAVLAPAGVASAAVLPGSNYDPAANPNSLYTNELLIDASDNAWNQGLTGKGVDVAIIDTGVTPVQGLDSAGKVINGPDLSFDNPDPNRRNLDFYGHGTHLAGIVAANDAPSAFGSDYANHPERVTGIAPDARIVNMKVGDSKGVVDVTQVIAALTWLTQHKNDPGLNIRVVVLAYGNDSKATYQGSPLAHAVEQAWKAGLVVVISAGNRGKLSGSLDAPANDPFAIAVGASDTRNTFDITDDNVPLFSSSGDGVSRGPDVVAPGVSITSLRVPGSVLDTTWGWLAGVGPRYFKGTGTSQAAAIVGGAVAILLQQRPNLTPNQVKALLKSTAVPLVGEDAKYQGAGRIDLDPLLAAPTPANLTQSYKASTGKALLDPYRGSMRATMNGVPIAGEVDIFGRPYNSTMMALSVATRTAWNGGLWNGSTWSGSTWSGSTWSGSTWSGSTWSGSTWSGSSWTGSSWTGSSWTGAAWSGARYNKGAKVVARGKQKALTGRARELARTEWGSTWS